MLIRECSEGITHHEVIKNEASLLNYFAVLLFDDDPVGLEIATNYIGSKTPAFTIGDDFKAWIIYNYEIVDESFQGKIINGKLV